MTPPARPAGWPAGLVPPGDYDFPEAAVRWLLDQGPPELRTSELRRYPAALALAVRHHVDAALEAARGAYRESRVALGPLMAPDEVEAAQRGLEALGARLLQVQREVRMVSAELLAGGAPGPSRP